jgi:hypothetical protein
MRKGPTPLRIGDTPYDAAAAGKAGIATIGVLCGGFTERSLREAGCVEIYPDRPRCLLASGIRCWRHRRNVGVH